MTRCRQCGGTYVEKASVMGEPVLPYCRGCGRVKDGPTIGHEAWRSGPWDHEGAPHRAPWDTVPGYVWVGTVWADAEQTTPVAFEDHDGCRAVAIERVAS